MNHMRSLTDFVEAQASYFDQCNQHAQELQKQLASGTANDSETGNGVANEPMTTNAVADEPQTTSETANEQPAINGEDVQESSSAGQDWFSRD
ncbi:endophilin-B1-like protein [Lates japonicus]|uniref:Endophilin-B1-like protein n=1 Tax=Lates japonicus TaxID=270547 RepID=A0AAD3RLC1_LATJO|nr:endophilin-B1-like protein [Lates japonicus]